MALTDQPDKPDQAEVTTKEPTLWEKALAKVKTWDPVWVGLTVLFVIGLFLSFWTLFLDLPKMWFGLGDWEWRSGDGYYSHGILVPLISAYIIYRRWDDIKNTPVKPGWLGLGLLLVTFFIIRAADATDIQQIRSFAFIFVLLGSVWVVAGIRWMFVLSPSILYLLFMLPVWTAFIDQYTNPLQIISTKISYKMLDWTGFQPFKENATTIHLDTFTLDVGIPCSGLKLVVAVAAFTIFFMLIDKLKWWGNIIMASLVLPLCLFVNGLRIAMIGMVGEWYGQQAGHDFHDYSGYITLLLCFFILFKAAKLLGWQD